MRAPGARRFAVSRTVIHLAAAIRDQPAAKVEELNGLATARLLRTAEQAGVERFIFFSAIGATEFQRTRFFRAKALAEEAVARSELETTIFAPSIVYDREDPWVTLTRRLALFPALPLIGDADAAFEPIWAQDVGRCVIAELDSEEAGDRRYELAGPELLTYEQMSRVIAWTMDRPRRVVHVPPNLVRLGLNGVRRIVGDAAFATWEEAELLRGTDGLGARDRRRRGARRRPEAHGGRPGWCLAAPHKDDSAAPPAA